MCAMVDLRHRISELSHQKKQLKFDLRFLEIDAIDLRRGDAETREVDQVELDLIENRIRCLTDQVEEMKVELVSLRDLQEGLTSDLKRVQHF